MNHLGAQPTAPIFLMADLDKTEDQFLQWLNDGGWTSPPHDLTMGDSTFKTLWQSSRALAVAVEGNSWIDHILLHSSARAAVLPIKVKLALGSYWLTCTDHRPIVLTVQKYPSILVRFEQLDPGI